MGFNSVNATGNLTQISNGTLTASNANYGGDLIIQQYNTGVAYPQYSSTGGALQISAVIANAANPTGRTGDPLSGSAIISGLPSTSDLYPGMPVSGTGIPAGATVLAIDSSSSITLSVPATAGDGATAYSLSFQSANGLTKSGPGVVILNSVGNTYSGPTTIGGGTLQVGDGTTSSSLGSGAVINDASLVFDPGSSGLTVGNSISGVGVLSKIGSATLVLSGTNGYSGGTTVSGGILRFASTAALPTSGLITISSGAYAGIAQDVNTSGFLNQVSTSSTGVLGLDGSTSGGLDLRTPGFSDSLRVGSSTSGTLSGTFIPAGNTYRVGGGGGLLTIASNLSDTGWSTGLEMNTSGTLPAGAVILTGTNTYSGGTLVSSGTLNIAEPYSLPSNTPLTVGAGGRC